MARKAQLRSHGAALRRAQRRKQGVTVAGSFLLAVTLWFLVSLNVRTFETHVVLPVEVTDIPKELNLSEAPPREMEVTVKGKGLNLLYQQLRRTPDTLQIDFPSYQATGSFEAGAHLEVINLHLEKGLQAITCQPNEVSLANYKKQSKRVALAYNLDFKLLESLRLSQPVELQPDSVLVIGPREALDTLVAWQMPDFRLTSPIQKDTNLYLTLEPKPPFEVVQKEIKVAVDVEDFTEEMRNVQLTWRNLPDGMHAQMSTQTVVVHYLVPLNRYDEVKNANFTVTVDYHDLTPDSKLLFPEVENLPEGIASVRIQPSWVECVITQ